MSLTQVTTASSLSRVTDGWSITFEAGPNNTDNVKMEKGSTELLFVPLKQRQDMTEDDWTQMMHWANKSL